MKHFLTRRLAFLIDADTVSPDFAPALFAERMRYGAGTVGHIHMNWTAPAANQWAAQLRRYAKQPMQLFADVAGGTTGCTSLIIDAMDLLHAGYTDFYLVSSDGNLARLAARIHEQSGKVCGFGEQHTPAAFVSACDSFISLETLSSSAVSRNSDGQRDRGHCLRRAINEPKSKTAPFRAEQEQHALLRKERYAIDTIFGQIRDAVDAVADQNGRTTLAALGTQLLKQIPAFDVRDYGYAKLSQLADDCPFLGVERVGDIIQAITVRIVPVA